MLSTKTYFWKQKIYLFRILDPPEPKMTWHWSSKDLVWDPRKMVEKKVILVAHYFLCEWSCSKFSPPFPGPPHERKTPRPKSEIDWWFGARWLLGIPLRIPIPFIIEDRKTIQTTGPQTKGINSLVDFWSEKKYCHPEHSRNIQMVTFQKTNIELETAPLEKGKTSI